jgi:hypothetical protein
MPYNPGVVDRSGEILAQSRLSAGNALLQGLTGGIETYKKNRLQNQILTGENDALLAGLQQLQGMQGGAAIANLAPAGMNKLVEKHTQGGGLGLNESMQLNAMLNTTLKTAQAGQQMQAQQLNQQIAAQQLQNEIMAGRQAQQDSAGLVNALKELASLEAPSQKDVIGIISRQNLSPKAMGQFTEFVGKTAPKELKAPTGVEALVQDELAAFEAQNRRPATPAESAKIRRDAMTANRAQTNINLGENAETASRVKILEEDLKADIAAGKTARTLAPGIAELNSLFKEGLNTNRLAPFKTKALSLAKGLGLSVDEKELEKLETAEAYFTQQILGFVQQTKGAVSNKENELFAAMGPGMQRSEATNRRLLKVASDRLRLEAQIADVVRNGLSRNLSFEVINDRKQELIDQYDAKLPALDELEFERGSMAAPTSVAAPANMAEAAKAELARRNAAKKK